MPIGKQSEVQTLDIPFTGALDQSVAEHLLEPGRQFAQFTNCQMDKLGRVRPRPCFAALDVSGVDCVVPERLLSHSGKMLALTVGGTGVQDEGPAGLWAARVDVTDSNGVEWDWVGPVSEYTAERRPCITSPGADVLDGDMAAGAQYDVFVYIDTLQPTYTMRLILRDTNTGIVHADSLVSGAGSDAHGVRVTRDPVSNTVLVTYWRGANQDIYGFTIDTLDATVGEPVTIATDVHALSNNWQPYDVCPRHGGTWVVSYWMTSGGQVLLATRILNAALSSVYMYTLDTSTFAVTPLAGISVLSIEPEDGVYQVWVAWAQYASLADDGVFFAVFDDTLSTVVHAKTLAMNTALVASGGGVQAMPTSLVHLGGYNVGLSVSQLEAGFAATSWTRITAPSTVSIETPRTLDRCGLVSKLWVFDNKVFGVVRDAKQQTYFVVCLCSAIDRFVGYARPVTTSAYLTAYSDALACPGKLQSVALAGGSSGLVRTLVPVWLSVLTGSDPANPTEDKRAGLNELYIRRRDSRTFQTAVLDGVLYISGGLLHEFDGSTIYENGFVQDPWCSLSDDPTGLYGTQFPLGVWTAVVVFDWFDSRGRRHRSQPSFPAQRETVLPDYKLIYLFKPCELTLRQEKHGHILMSPYISTLNSSVLYRLYGWEVYPSTTVKYGHTTPGASTKAGGLLNARNSELTVPFFLSSVGIAKNGAITPGGTAPPAIVVEGAIDVSHHVRVRVNSTDGTRANTTVNWYLGDPGSSSPALYGPAVPIASGSLALGSTGLTVWFPDLTYAADNVWDWESMSFPTYHEMLYAPVDGSGELANHPVWGGCTHLVAHRGRLWAASAEFPSRLVYSKESLPGVPMSFYPPGFELDVGDTITALASVGEYLVAFTEDAIYAITGEGPDRTGRGGSFSAPTRLPSDVGCLDWRSVATIPAGVLFKSGRGIMLLDRSLNVIPVGEPVRETAEAAGTILAATVLPRSKQVRFLTNSASARYLVLDYQSDNAWRWYVWSQHTSIVPVTAGLSASVSGAPGEYRLALNDGRVLRESSALIADLDTQDYFKASTLRTGPMHFGRLSQFKRLQKIAVHESPSCAQHITTISYVTSEGESEAAFNFSPADSQSWWAPYDPILTTPFIGKQQARAYDITISAGLPPGGLNKDVAPLFEWRQLGLLVMSKPESLRRRK